jgi:prepilin-type processing-associated H-X9-DG protein
VKRNILIAALTALCASPVAAYEIEPVFVKSWSISAADFQGGPDKAEALHNAPSGPNTSVFFLKNSNAPSAVGQPMVSPLQTVPPATTPTLPAGPHSNGANAALHDGSVRFNHVGKSGAFAGAPPRR